MGKGQAPFFPVLDGWQPRAPTLPFDPLRFSCRRDEW